MCIAVELSENVAIMIACNIILTNPVTIAGLLGLQQLSLNLPYTPSEKKNLFKVKFVNIILFK